MQTIQKVTIFYFSGTGNARRIALWFSEFAEKKGIDCQIQNIASCDFSKISMLIENSLVLIISPTHGFNFPKITLDFIRRFPNGKNRVVLMNTRAGMKIGSYVTPGLTGIALLLSSLILKSKGYHIVGQIPFDMPSNWLSLHPALNEKTVKYLHKVNYERAERHSQKIFSGENDFIAYRDLIQDILISPIALAYYLVGRFIIAKSFYASLHCNACFSCIRQCPVQAIQKIQERPYWTFRCESCIRCMNNCPQRAIDTSHGFIVIVSILSSAIFSYFLQKLPLFIEKSLPLRWLISTAIFMVVLWLLYHAQHYLLRYRVFAKFISHISLTFYSFWGRYKSIPDDQWKK